MSVAVRAVGGKIDQGGGVVWRYADANNYYVCRYNPLEENFRVYSVKGGKRTQLATKENVELSEGKWFTVSVKHAGDRIECSLNGEKVLDVTDKTFPDAGKVGVWCKADAASHFDRVRFTPAGK
ncbi:MAG TPA: family 16 glycoside hydrolase [Gemmataceae bacterium]|nr:family 16 glycoside hydrolase [Gemmataceae bacterium]